jgi:transporter family protein
VIPRVVASDNQFCDFAISNLVQEGSFMAQRALTSKWFWYSILCILCWGGWTILAKLGSQQISAEGAQFLFAWGMLPVAVVLLAGRRFRLENNPAGIFYSVAGGVLAAIGGWALFAAYRTGENTSVITVATAMYPLFSVLLAMLVLRERLTRLHMIGLAFAVCAFIVFAS